MRKQQQQCSFVVICERDLPRARSHAKPSKSPRQFGQSARWMRHLDGNEDAHAFDGGTASQISSPDSPSLGSNPRRSKTMRCHAMRMIKSRRRSRSKQVSSSARYLAVRVCGQSLGRAHFHQNSFIVSLIARRWSCPSPDRHAARQRH